MKTEWRNKVMAKGTPFTQQFKEDAVRYKKEHPELSLQQAATKDGLPDRRESAENAVSGDDRHHKEMDWPSTGLGADPLSAGNLF